MNINIGQRHTYNNCHNYYEVPIGVQKSTCDSNVLRKMRIIIGPLILIHLKKYISYNLVNNLILNYYQRYPIIILITEKKCY